MSQTITAFMAQVLHDAAKRIDPRGHSAASWRECLACRTNFRRQGVTVKPIRPPGR